MKKIEYVITDPRGIHARPAGQLVKLVSGFKSACQLGKEGELIDGKRLLAVMKLAMQQGDTMVLHFDGEDEEQAASATEQFLKENL